jgi:hypothetical protein
VTETLSSTFMERYFGEHSAACSAAFVAAGNEAHSRSLDAKIGSRLKSNHAYGGTFWLALPEEVVSRLQVVLPGAMPIPAKGAQYELLVWNSIAILAVKVMEGRKRDGRMRARVSDLRTRLTRVNGPTAPTAPEATLFDYGDALALDEFEEEARMVAEAARAAIGNVATKMVIAAYACTAKSGLQVVRVGVATLETDGAINFSDSEQLSLIETTDAAAKPMPVAGESFDSTPRPKPFLEAVEDERTATGEVEPDDNPDTRQPE